MANITIQGNNFHGNASVFGGQSKTVAVLTQRVSADDARELFVDCFGTAKRAKRYLLKQYQTVKEGFSDETVQEYYVTARNTTSVFFVRTIPVR